MSPSDLLDRILDGTDDGAAAVVLRARPTVLSTAEEDR
jgi:hypothetical protein